MASFVGRVFAGPAGAGATSAGPKSSRRDRVFVPKHMGCRVARFLSIFGLFSFAVPFKEATNVKAIPFGGRAALRN